MFATAHVTYYNPFRAQSVAMDVRLDLQDVLDESDGDLVQYIQDFRAIPYEWNLTGLTVREEIHDLSEEDSYA